MCYLGTHLSIDETCLSTGEVYTILSNKEAHGRKGCLVAIVKGTKAKEVTSVLKKIPEAVRLLVEEVTLDFSDSMHQIVSACFPKAMITLDRFHHQQFCLEALQELRIGHRREVMTEVANARDDFRAMIKDLIKSGKPLVDAEGKPIRSNAAAMYDREDEILNYFVNRSTNASAESLNAKIKDFRAQLRGVIDKKFFIFRLVKIFG